MPHLIRYFNLFTIALFAMLPTVVVASGADIPSISKRVEQMHEQGKKQKGGPQISEQDKAIMENAARKFEAQLPQPGLPVGSKAPDFTLTNAYGKPVRLYDKLKEGPVVLTFYRGGWCPYCNIEMRALYESLPHFKQYQAQVVAVSPQRPDKSLEQVKKDKFPFELLSDLDDAVAKKYNLYLSLPADLLELYKSKFMIDIEAYNGKGRTGLPVPATFVIQGDGTIVAGFADLDYKKRMEPADIVAALKKIAKK